MFGWRGNEERGGVILSFFVWLKFCCCLFQFLGEEEREF